LGCLAIVGTTTQYSIHRNTQYEIVIARNEVLKVRNRRDEAILF
jgi:hypothetical protein